jgi:hypothetical protein
MFKQVRFSIILSLLISIFLSSACAYQTFPVTQTYEETLYRTEYTDEPYTENSTIVHTDTGEFELTSYYKWHTTGLSYYGYDIPYYASYDNVSLRFSIWRQLQPEPVTLRIYDMSNAGQIPSPEPLLTEELLQPQQQPDWYFIRGNASPDWLKTANIMINQGKFLGSSEYMFSKKVDPQVIVLKAGKPSMIAVLVNEGQNRWNSRFTVEVLWARSTIEQNQTVGKRPVARQVPYQVQRQRTVYQVKQVPFWETIFGSK